MSRLPSDFDPDAPRTNLAKVIPRRPRVSWGIGIVLAVVFAALVTPAITADRWLAQLGIGRVLKDQLAPLTVRVPVFAGIETADHHVSGGGIVIARGQLATIDDAALAESIAAATPGGALPYAAFGVLALVLAAIFTHHMRRSTRGRLLRVQAVSLVAIALLAWSAKAMLLGTALSVLVVPVALLAMVPTMVLDRIVGLATGVLAALVVSLLGPFDLGVAILMLVQAAVAGLVIAERPKQRIRAALVAGGVTTLFTAATYVLLVYLTSGAMPRFDLQAPWIAAAIGPAIAMALAAPLVPLYQLLVGEITQGKLVDLEDLSNPLLKQIAERSPGTWQHSLMMANLAEIAANTIGANGRLVRVGAYYHDLGKSLQPKYFIENLESGEPSPHDRLPPEVSCDAIFSHVTEGIVTARKAGLHERIVDFMHMHHGDGVLEYFWGKCREQGNPHGLSIERFRYPGHPPQSRETAILAICDAVEAASRTLKKPEPAAIDSLVQRIVYGKLHLGQLDESGLSMADLRRVSDSLRETIRHANHGRIEYPWQKAPQDASATSQATTKPTAGTEPRLDSLDRKPNRETGMVPAITDEPRPSASLPIELGVAERKRPSEEVLDTAKRSVLANADTASLNRPPDLGILETVPLKPPASASHQGEWEQLSQSKIANLEASSSQRAAQDTDAEYEAERARKLGDELPAGSAIPAPDGVISPSTFAGVKPPTTPTARKRAATLPPVPPTPTPMQGRPGSSSSPPPSPPAVGHTLQGLPPGVDPQALERAAASSAVLPRAAFDSSFAVPAAVPEPRTSRDSSAPVFATSADPRNRSASSAPSPSARPSTQPSTLPGTPVPNRGPARDTEERDAAPDPEKPPGLTTLQGRPAPKHLPASGTGPMRPVTASETRSAGPPAPVDLENATTNPPPLRRGPSGPPTVRAPEEPITTPRLAFPPVTHVGHVSGQFELASGSTDSIEDAGSTEPSLPKIDLPLRAPPTNLPPPPKSAKASLAERVDAALEDEWQPETPVVAPTRAELRSLLGAPDPTRKQSLAELERLHRAVDEVSEPELLPNRRPAPSTAEVDPDDIESAIEIAPPARRPGSVAVAKPKKPE